MIENLNRANVALDSDVRMILDVFADGIIIQGKDGRIELANQATINMLGNEFEQIYNNKVIKDEFNIHYKDYAAWHTKLFTRPELEKLLLHT